MKPKHEKISTAAPPRWGSSLLRVGVPAAIAVLAVLFFHPGAMMMDRIKWSLILCITLPLLLVTLRGSLKLSVLAPLSPALAAFTLIPLAMIFSCLRTGLPSLEESRLVLGLLVLLVLAVAVRDGAWERPRLIPAALLGCGALAALLSVVQAAGFEPFYLENPGCEAVSTLGNTNAAAEVYAILVPLALAGLLAYRGGAARMLCGTALFLLAAGLVATGSRGGLLAALAGMALFALVVERARLVKNQASGGGSLLVRHRRTLIAAVIVVLAGGGTVALVESRPGSAFKTLESEESLFSPSYPSNLVRLAIWESTLDMIGDHPIMGAGPGRFRSDFPAYRNPEEARVPGRLGAVTEVENPHNEFLWAAAEGGVVAALLLAAFFLLLLRQCLVACGTAREPERAFQAAGLAGAVAAFVVVGLVRAPLHNPASACLLFLLAGSIDATRFESGMIAHKGMLARFAGLGGLVVTAALALHGGRALLADMIFAEVGVSQEIGLEQYNQLKNQALPLDDGNLEMVNFLGQVAAKLSGTRVDAEGLYSKDARRFLGDVLARHPRHTGALRTLGRLELLAGHLESGRHLIGKALALTGSTTSPEDAAIAILEDAGRFDEAARFIDRFGFDRARLLEQGAAMLAAGRARDAALYADTYLKNHPLHVEALHLKARSLRELGDGGEKSAFHLMQLAVSLDWMASGSWIEARNSAERSLRYKDGDLTSRLLVAVAAAALESPFEPPETSEIDNKAVVKRLKELDRAGKLPPTVHAYLLKLRPR